jgi:AbrB family looped-hinge helix DNA binding protein
MEVMKMIADKKDKRACCYNVESVVTIDDRGQMVLPKDIRVKAGIRAGDKMAVVLMEKDGEVCCLSLVKTENFSNTVKELLE